MIMESSSRRVCILAGLFMLFAVFAVPSHALLMNANSIDLIRNLSAPEVNTFNSPLEGINISFTSFEIGINFTSNTSFANNLSIYVDNSFQNYIIGGISNNTKKYYNISTKLSNGTHSIFVSFMNDTEGERVNSTTTNFTVDDTAPVISFSYLTVNASNTSDTTPGIIVNVTDNVATSGINLTIFVDGLVSGVSNLVANATNVTLNTSNLANGTHTINIHVTDPARNSVNSTVLTLIVDDTAPLISFSYLTVNATNTSDTTPAVIVNTTDNVAPTELNLTLFVNGAVNGVSQLVVNATNTSLSTTALINGTYSIQVQVTDPAGNNVNSTVLTLYVDDAKPVISFS